jgi:Methyltransferase domain
MNINILATFFKRLQNSYRLKVALEWLKWKAFLVRHFFPLGLKRGDWSLNIDDFEAVFKKIRIAKHKKSIIFVELGCGVSTIIFGIFLSRLNPKTSIISFEGDKEWVVKVDALIKRYDLCKQVSVYYIPYKQYAQYIWFDDKKIVEIINGRQIDMLFVDAPPGKLCPYSRKPAIPFFLQWMLKETIVLLHDTGRKDEAEIVKIWSKYFKIYECIDTKLGIAFCNELNKTN